MQVDEALERLGGVASRAQLLEACSRADVERAVRGGLLIKVARGRYVGKQAGEAAVLAHRLTGALVGTSAALARGWAVKHTPARVQVAVPRNRRPVASHRDDRVELHRVDLAPEELVAGVLDADRTLLHCARHLPFDEALSVADSAMRAGFSASRLAALAQGTSGPGSRRIRRVAAHADARAANPFESVLRAIAVDVPGLDLTPQVPLYDAAGDFIARPDLVDRELRVVLEADSFEWHGDRAALARDARRYNRMVVAGWLVLRFSYEEVMGHPGAVLRTLRGLVDRRTQTCLACDGAA